MLAAPAVALAISFLPQAQVTEIVAFSPVTQPIISAITVGTTARWQWDHECGLTIIVRPSRVLRGWEQIQTRE
jgi:hypothetical protein